jgi:hypothetical protein
MVIACQWPATRRMSVVQIYRFVVSRVHSVCEVFVVILPLTVNKSDGLRLPVAALDNYQLAAPCYKSIRLTESMRLEAYRCVIFSIL